MQGSETIHFDDGEEPSPTSSGNRPAAGARQTSLEEALAQGLVGSTPNPTDDFLGLTDDLPPGLPPAVEEAAQPFIAAPVPAPVYEPARAASVYTAPAPMDFAAPAPPAAVAAVAAAPVKRSAKVYALAGLAGVAAVLGVGIVLRGGKPTAGDATTGQGAPQEDLARLAPQESAESGQRATESAAARKSVGAANPAGPAMQPEARVAEAGGSPPSQVPAARSAQPKSVVPRGLISSLGDAFFAADEPRASGAVDEQSLAYRLGSVVGGAVVASSFGPDALPTPAYASPPAPERAGAGTPRPTAPRIASQPVEFDAGAAAQPAFAGGDVALIWQADTVPLEHLGAAGKILTPSVGQVRVVRTSGDLFEGRLYAVGQGKIWLDTESGRVVLDAKATSGIDRISPNAPGGAQALQGERVCARTVGGPIFGRLVAQDGDRVTLITDQGAKLVLTGATIEPAKSSSGVKLNP